MNNTVQVAHFYNTIDEQMLPCQQAMMLDEALAFERLVMPNKKEEGVTTITWDQPSQLEAFIEKLQQAADNRFE